MREWINNSKEGQSECAKIRVSGRMIGSLKLVKEFMKFFVTWRKSHRVWIVKSMS